MPAPLRVKLNTEEDPTLRELSSANGVPVRVKQRPLALRLNACGWNVPWIAEYLEWAQKTVRETIEPWQQGGLGRLWEKPGRERQKTQMARK